jgi:arsenical-resistance protein
VLVLPLSATRLAAPAPNRHLHLTGPNRQIRPDLPGHPLAAGYLSRRFGEKAKGRTWYETRYLPTIVPWALYGLLFTIVILFALQGHQITTRPWDVARIAVPLLAYFAIMWGGGYLLDAGLGLGYERTTTLAFTSAGNNFELAIAVAIATYGAASGQALASVVGPLIEVPVLVALVYVSLALRPRLSPTPPAVVDSSWSAHQ